MWVFNLGDVELYFHDSELGYLAKPDQRPSPGGIVFCINRAGLRGPDSSPIKKPGALRLTFISESVTFGSGIVSDTDANTFVGLSEAQLSRATGRSVDTVSISAPGCGISNMEHY